MADSLLTNPIVIDLTDTSARSIKLGEAKVHSIVASGLTHASLPSRVALRAASASGALQYHVRGNLNATVQESTEVGTVLRDMFFNNESGNAWQTSSWLLIYLV